VTGSRPRLWLALAYALAVLGTGAPLVAAPVAAARPAAGPSLSILGSPFDPDGDGKRDRVRIVVSLDSDAEVDVRIEDFDGRLVRTLASGETLPAGEHVWPWDGRRGSGGLASPGPYRVRVTARSTGEGTVRRATWVTLAERVPYPTRPEAVLVAIDPGHGGLAAGATWRGLAEDDVNLEIGLRLEAMLRGAGVRVLMTRRTDRNVNRARKDLDRDGRYTRPDELIARNDLANTAGADVHIAIHNNAAACHCVRGTEMYTHGGRTWSREGVALARYVQREHIRHLRTFPGFRPRDNGVKTHPYQALRPYHRRKMPRPSLQPSMLGESLFIDQPSEHRVLARRSGRTAIAAAYFDGIARYLGWRKFGLRFEVLDAPTAVRAGGRVDVRLRLTNSGRVTTSGWRLRARIVKAVFRYDGRPRRGDVVAGGAIPDGIGPGESVEVVFPGVRMPRARRTWLLKLDVDLPGGTHLSDRGVVGPQLRIRTLKG
jgi:N-acetylmuramoyl-L-alanine amidase